MTKARASAPKRIKCAALTKKGKPCRNYALKAGRFCLAHSRQETSALSEPPKRIEPGRWKLVQQWGTFLLAFMTLLLSGFIYRDGLREQEEAKKREVNRLLDRAWDLLGGEPGTDLIIVASYDRPDEPKLVLADRLIQEALEIRPDMSRAYGIEGAYHHQRGDLEKAEAKYLKLLELEPGMIEAYANLAIILRDQGRLEEAESILRMCIRRSDEMVHSSAAGVHMNLGSILASQGRYEEAEQSQRMAIQIDPEFALAYASLAGVLSSLGKDRRGEAIEAYQKAIQLSPGFAAHHSNLGFLYLADLRWEEAESSFRRAIELDPGHSKRSIFHFNLGSVLLLKGENQEAERTFTEALRADPELPAAHHNLGEALRRQKHYAEAEKNFLTALQQYESDPDYGPAHSFTQKVREDLAAVRVAMAGSH